MNFLEWFGSQVYCNNAGIDYLHPRKSNSWNVTIVQALVISFMSPYEMKILAYRFPLLKFLTKFSYFIQLNDTIIQLADQTRVLQSDGCLAPHQGQNF